MKIALAQIDPTVGDFTGNLEKIVAVSRRAADLGARFTVFSELAICGYPPADFLEKPSFLARCRSAVGELAAATRRLPTAVLAGVALPSGGEDGKPAFNAAVLLDRGQLLLEQYKRLLPFYDVFDEQRIFSPSPPQKVIDFEGVRLAVTICEDAWNDKNFWPRRLYTVDPMEELMRRIRRCTSTSLPLPFGTTNAPSAAKCWPPSPAATPSPCSCATRPAATIASSSTVPRWLSMRAVNLSRRPPRFRKTWSSSTPSAHRLCPCPGR